MARTDFTIIDCSIAKTMAILGEPWTPMVLRDLFMGASRFDQLRVNLGVSRKVLTERLARLVADGVVVRQMYTDRPPRYDYVLTEKGWELCDVLLAVTAWGDRWTTGSMGVPAIIRHHRCGEIVSAEIRCSSCGELLRSSEVVVTPRESLPG
jgi:DNA-binding HxlR family transcriptional regulator